jgi:23S rRNA (cytidine2498-2'-O)-methyltransferase
MPDANPFVFTVCQAGAEWALKDEVAQRWPGLRFAFSRPGFVTFKVLEGSVEEHLASLGGSAFARTHGISLENVTADERDALAQQFWASVARTAGDERFEHLHVWQLRYFDQASPKSRVTSSCH